MGFVSIYECNVIQTTYVFVLGGVRALLVAEWWVGLDNAGGDEVVQLLGISLKFRFKGDLHILRGGTCPGQDDPSIFGRKVRCRSSQ